MIYVDTSVVLAQLLAEDRQPPDALWEGPVVSSRLLEYEVWVRIHARSLTTTHGELARELLSRLAWVELSPAVLVRALDPFPVPVRTLDALHLASLAFLRDQGLVVPLASYDQRQLDAANALELTIFSL